jgi:hypothetical protein
VLPSSNRGRFVLAGVAGSLALLLGSAGVMFVRANAAWDRFCRATDELEREIAARLHHRDPLWGEPRAESAFAHYGEAMALEPDGRPPVPLATPDDELVALPMRARWQLIAGAVHRGAHATDTTPLAKSMLADTRSGAFNLLCLRGIANVATLECRARLQEGRALDAVGLALDTATLALDVAQRADTINQVIAGATLGIVSTAWTEARLAKTPAAALDKLAHGLERLDRAWPASWDADSELLATARGLQHVLAKGEAEGSWRYGFSARWELVDSFTGYARVMRELATVEQSWPRRVALLGIAFADEQARGNVLTEHTDGTQHTIERSARRVIAELRLLRMAVDLHRGRAMPPLRDPLGDGPIVVTHSPEGTRLSCAAEGDNAVERLVHK